MAYAAAPEVGTPFTNPAHLLFDKTSHTPSEAMITRCNGASVIPNIVTSGSPKTIAPAALSPILRVKATDYPVATENNLGWLSPAGPSIRPTKNSSASLGSSREGRKKENRGKPLVLGFLDASFERTLRDETFCICRSIVFIRPGLFDAASRDERSVEVAREEARDNDFVTHAAILRLLWCRSILAEICAEYLFVQRNNLVRRTYLVCTPFCRNTNV